VHKGGRGGKGLLSTCEKHSKPQKRGERDSSVRGEITRNSRIQEKKEGAITNEWEKTNREKKKKGVQGYLAEKERGIASATLPKRVAATGGEGNI